MLRVAGTLLMVIVAGSKTWAVDDVAAIKRVKNMSAHQLDAALPAQKFSSWLKVALGTDAQLSWDVNDCGENSGTGVDRGRNMPICVGVKATLSLDLRAQVLVAVGTSKGGVLAGGPELFDIMIVHKKRYIDVRRLRDLAPMLRQLQEAK